MALSLCVLIYKEGLWVDSLGIYFLILYVLNVEILSVETSGKPEGELIEEKEELVSSFCYKDEC
jgi:hypothetical protein